MIRMYVGVGSNIDPEANIPAALRTLASLPQAVCVAAISNFYRTAPIGSPDSPDFYNGVIAVDSQLDLRDLQIGVLSKVERMLGRTRSDDRNAPRTIDLDIILCGDQVIHNGTDYVVPAPDILNRPFLAFPLLELDPEIVLPVFGRLADLTGRMDHDTMTPLPEFTHRLRQEMNLEP